MKDYYQILGISRNASSEEIKSAYRKLANKYHPDVSTDKDANEKMAEINEAYQTLRDPEKRAQYDQFGEAASQFQDGSNSESYYKPNSNYYEYNRGYFYSKGPISLGKFIFRIVFIFLLINALFSLGSLLIQRAFFTDETIEVAKEQTDFQFTLDEINATARITGLSRYIMDTSIQSIEIPATITNRGRTYKVISIGQNCFKNCTNLTSVSIPSSVTLIDSYAFYRCNKLGTVYYYGTMDQFSKITIRDGNPYFKNATIVCYDFTI